MPLGLTWLDVLLIVALAMLLVQGHRRGLWVVLGNLVGLVGGAAIAFYALPEVAEFVTAPQWRWAALIATLVLLVAAGQYVGAAIGEAIRLRVNLPALRLVDRLLGALAAGLAGALVLWLVAFSIAASGSTAVTREVTRSQVITALDAVMPDSLLAWAARSRSAVADLDVLGGHVEDAFARLVRFIALHPGDDRETARAHLVDLYTVVGADDPRVHASRRKLASALF